MARRYVRHSTIDDLGQINPKIVSVVSTKNSFESSVKDQTYFKRNYFDAISKLIPKFYFADEEVLSGTHIPFTSQLINSHITANNNQGTILPVSALTYDTYLSAINTPSGFSHYFYKQNAPAAISSDDFERDFLLPLNKTYKDFGTSSEFLTYVSGTFLPSIPAVTTVDIDLANLTVSSYSTDSSGTYKYLVNNLGWLYFLNRSGPGGGYDPSTTISELMATTLWKGRSIVLEDTLKIYQEYLWRNETVWGLSDKIIPVSYVSGTLSPLGTWTSGVQLLDNLKTLNEIVYSPHYFDSPDKKVETAFTDYFTTANFLDNDTGAGPFTRFLEALSFSLADTQTESGELTTLYDIGECPDEFLDLLGELIGWNLLGSDVDKWRVQLRNAVDIYKKKGTKRAIQILLNVLFGTDSFNVTTHIRELYESFIPDLIYYSLATSSDAFKDFTSWTPEVATQLRVADYSYTSMNMNIKYAVDTILFHLVREFPHNFWLGGNQFPQLKLVLAPDPSIIVEGGHGVVWEGPYHIIKKDNEESVYRTGVEETSESVTLTIEQDPNFIFRYRHRDFPIPPYEKKQFYTHCTVTPNLIDRLGFLLKCFGVNANFVTQLTNYIKEYTTDALDTSRFLNKFLLFGTSATYPPNYAQIITNATKEKEPDPVSLLSLWNGKSSHFLMLFDASSFDWMSHSLRYDTKYGITKIMDVLDQVIPAHAIPEVLLTLSSISDNADALADNSCRELRPNFKDLYEGSSSVTTNFGACAVDMAYVQTSLGELPNRFKRQQVTKTSNALFSGTGETFPATNDYGDTTPYPKRNSLRRRNYHFLLPDTKLFTREGRNNPGSFELSNSYYSASVGYLPLGFMPSSLIYKEVGLQTNPNGYGIGNLLYRVHPVWGICENLDSANSYFGYSVSDTYASRARLSLASSDCQPYGRRGQLNEILYVMNKVHDKEKFLQASSILSGYYNENGTINSRWATSSTLLSPMDFSSWYAEGTVGGYPISVINSAANQLVNNESADDSLSYYEHFKFGMPVHRLFNNYNSSDSYKGHPLSENYRRQQGGPNILSQIYGPYIYNSDFEKDGSSIGVSGFLQASSPLAESNISYYGGSGVLSMSGTPSSIYDVGTELLDRSTHAYLSRGEFFNKNLVSGIELVDSSSPTAFTGHPIFSLFKFPRSVISTFDFNKFLVNNLIVKYHRSTDPTVFPRIRIKIDNSDTYNKARNFLNPNHVFTTQISAHNMDTESELVGGLVLGFWIRTEPEANKVWVFDPKGISDECGVGYSHWKQVALSDLQQTGINIAHKYAQTYNFEYKVADTGTASGGGPDAGAKSDQRQYSEFMCYEAPVDDAKAGIPPGSSPQTIIKVGNNTRSVFDFKFSTNNDYGSNPTDDYLDRFGPVHRLDQKYVLEYFVMQGDNTKFIVFEDISLQDLTYKNNYALIQTEYGDALLDKKDLVAVFRFFKDLQIGNASRNYTITSGVMEDSGGSRLNYRSNIQMYDNTVDGTYDALSEVQIYEG